MTASTITPPRLDDVPRSIARVLDLLEHVLDAGESTLTDAATAVDLTPTTALRHLRALESRGYLRRDDGLFSVGPAMYRLATCVLEEGPLERLIVAVQPALNQLADSTGESCYLALRGKDSATYVAIADSPRAIRHVGHVGQEVPLTNTAVGAALAAPGTFQVRHGGFEPDIGAVSIGLGLIEDLDVAISVIGPTHRLDDAQVSAIQAEMVQVVGQLRTQLGIDDATATGTDDR